ncbi:MAG: DUF4349 domain-containing protein [Oscillospiraceae bacterium]|nr:DUF4349 domain-containing protein [Oscillospiraceae bacterium]
MKKKVSIIISIVFILVIASACASAGDNYEPETYTGFGMIDSLDNVGRWDDVDAPMSLPDAMPPADMAIGFHGDIIPEANSRRVANAGGAADEGSSTVLTSQSSDGLAEKIIYSVWAEIETREFDDTISKITSLIAANGAFIENSNVRGINLESQQYGWFERRNASYTIRVPVDKLDTMESSLGTLGNVTNSNRNATNVTSQFLDTEARVNSLLIQEERLLDMLSKSERISDLISIEERISNVRYQIEWNQTMLNNWQRQVDYSYLTLSIVEVLEYTEPPPPIDRGYWEKVGDGFMNTLRGVGNFFTTLFAGIIIAIPVLILLGIIAIIALLITKSQLRKQRKKREQLNASYYATQPATPVQDVTHSPTEQ